MCIHELDYCAICSPSFKAARTIRDIDSPRGGLPIPGFVAPLSAEYRGIQSFDTCPPVEPKWDDFHYHAPVVPLEGKVYTLPPVGRPWWVEQGMTFNPLTRLYVEDVPMDIEVPVEALDRTEEWQDF